MNPEQWLNKVETAIENRPRAEARSFCVVLVGDGVYCRPRRGQWPEEKILGAFTDRQLERGLSSRQWDGLKNKIVEFLEGQTSENKRLHKV